VVIQLNFLLIIVGLSQVIGLCLGVLLRAHLRKPSHIS